MTLWKRIASLTLICLLLFGLTACASQHTPPVTGLNTDTAATIGSASEQTPLDSPSAPPADTSAAAGEDDPSAPSAATSGPAEDTTDPDIPIQTHTCPTEDPYVGVNKTEFYANYQPACCNQDAMNRSQHGLLSGVLYVPGQFAQEAENRPQAEGKFVRNTAAVYLDDGNTYVIFDSNGNEYLRIHKAGGYITLEEVAAYMYAFGGVDGCFPANYTSQKVKNIGSSPWGEYLRGNHAYFIGDTQKYPYEPELPNISGCGGDLQYFEMDIGTTGTVTPGYAAKPYVQGSTINRGAARLVYARQDLNGNGVYEQDEVYVFYTHNHYNDFREYLNYYGGWGAVFGNETGGGEFSSKTNANPTPYIPTAYDDFSLWQANAA